MKRMMMSSSPSSYCDQEIEHGEREEDEEMVDELVRRQDGIAERLQCMTFYKRETNKRSEELSWDKYGLWREEQKSRAARIEKQLKARWELEELIEEQLNRFHAHYNQAMIPTRLKDVAEVLMPKWAPPQELTIMSWLGDWRPSAILELLRGLARSSSLSDTTGVDQLLAQLIHEIHIEETVIDEEMAEIQATCILHLPFSPLNCNRSGGAALRSIQAEFNKIKRVIIKAQQLRYKALELVVKKILNQTDVPEFLVAFAGVQDAIHQFAEQQRLQKGVATLPLKPSGSI
ncbi:hypothetical protein SLEP1_g44091 [Rubroshorea leprosula]|uniref:DOG1 domain-containing protein n=1 Tax=Rubroshorea leprosula TaxID=152421 RepID=A0AAV5LG24_9ROSI|nr:hypothetical protein SLEP1_g44091 [Rubroshorea leprosula]